MKVLKGKNGKCQNGCRDLFKINVFFLLNSIFFVFLFSGCAPRDQKLNKAGSDAGSANNNQFSDNAKYLSVLLDRQTEVIQIYKALHDANFAASKGIGITEKGSKSNRYQKEINLKTSLKSEKFQLQKNHFYSASLSLDENGVVSEATLEELNTSSLEPAKSGDSDIEVNSENVAGENNEKKADIKIKNRSKRISILRKSENVLAFSYLSIDELNSKATGKMPLQEILYSEVSVDAKLETFAVTSLQLSHQRWGSAQSGDFNLTVKPGGQLTILLKSSEQCAKVNGSFTLNESNVQSPRYSYNLNYSDVGISVSDKNKKNALFSFQPCENRPVVDLTRLL